MEIPKGFFNFFLRKSGKIYVFIIFYYTIVFNFSFGKKYDKLLKRLFIHKIKDKEEMKKFAFLVNPRISTGENIGIENIQNVKIAQHYEDCDNSYKHWGVHEPYEMHYGYWDENVKSHGDSLLRMNQVLGEKMKIKAGDNILDAGCGVGAISIWLAKNYKNIKATGISISKYQVSKAATFAKTHNIDDRTVFLERNFLSTGFVNNSFDIIFSVESFCHAENKLDFIKESYRILKSGGRLIIADYYLTKNKLNFFEKKIMHLFLNGWVVPNIPFKENFLQDIGKAGFKNIEHSDITKNILPSSKIMFKRGCTGLLVDKFIKHKNKVQYANTITCLFQYTALKMKLWNYLIIYAEKI